MIRSAGLAAALCLHLLASPASAQDCDALAAYNADHEGVSLIVLRDGEVVCESYSGPGGPDRAWALASGTKSFIGVMAAAAVQDGLLHLDDRIGQTSPRFAEDPRLAAISIRDVLSLTSGLSFGEFDRPGRPPSYDQAVEAARSVTEPGRRFAYGPGPFQLFGAVMQAHLDDAGLDADPAAYLQRRILNPIGIAPASWRASSGDPHLPSGLALTARDWARFGEFVRAGGVWNGRQLVDPEAFAAQFAGSQANPAYGLTWWLAEPVSADQRGAIRQLRGAADLFEAADMLPEVWMAAGAGKQRLYVIPSQQLVIVRQTAGVMAAMRGRGPDWSDAEFLALVLED